MVRERVTTSDLAKAAVISRGLISRIISQDAVVMRVQNKVVSGLNQLTRKKQYDVSDIFLYDPQEPIPPKPPKK